jgi:CRISPR-associated protein Cas5h
MQKLISIDLKADFGFFRKPDTNGTVNQSYNMLHKPALLGILGAIIGLEGYKEFGKLPQYYELLKDIKIGIQPIGDEKGVFKKTTIKYTNTVGYANKGSTFLTEEAVLINPGYRIYMLLDLNDTYQGLLYKRLKAGEAEYLPYFGKNEFGTCYDNYDLKRGSSFREDYPIEQSVYDGRLYEIKSIFCKSIVVRNSVDDGADDFTDIDFDFILSTNPFVYFERLPFCFEELPPKLEKVKEVTGKQKSKSPVSKVQQLALGFDVEIKPVMQPVQNESSKKEYQYKLESFSYTTAKMKAHVRLPNLFRIKQGEYVQLF